MSYDPESERAALRVRASDQSRTPGEQAAMEEASRCESLAEKYSEESPGDAKAFRAKADRWREMAVRARAEDLGGKS